MAGHAVFLAQLAQLQAQVNALVAPAGPIGAVVAPVPGAGAGGRGRRGGGGGGAAVVVAAPPAVVLAPGLLAAAPPVLPYWATWVPGTVVTKAGWDSISNDEKMDPALCSPQFIAAAKAMIDEHQVRVALVFGQPKVSAIKYAVDRDGEHIPMGKSGDFEAVMERSRYSRIYAPYQMTLVFKNGGAKPDMPHLIEKVIASTQLTGALRPEEIHLLANAIAMGVAAFHFKNQDRLAEYLTFKVKGLDPNQDFMALFSSSLFSFPKSSSTTEDRKRLVFTMLLNAVENLETAFTCFVNLEFRGVFDAFIREAHKLFAAGITPEYLKFILFSAIYDMGEHLQYDIQGAFDLRNQALWVTEFKAKLAEAVHPNNCNMLSQNASETLRTLIPPECLPTMKGGATTRQVGAKAAAKAAASTSTVATKKVKAAAGATTTAGATYPCLLHLTSLILKPGGTKCTMVGCRFDHNPPHIVNAATDASAVALCKQVLLKYTGARPDIQKAVADAQAKLASARSPKNPYV